MNKFTFVPLTALLLAPLVALQAADAEILSLTLDGAIAGPGRFAVEEIRREAVARGLTVVINDAKSPDDTLRITLALDASAGADRIPQSYGIAVQTEKGRRTVTVRGTDAVGAMYGGLDVAEAIRTGTLNLLQDSHHAPHTLNDKSVFTIHLAAYGDNPRPCQLLEDDGTTFDYENGKWATLTVNSAEKLQRPDHGQPQRYKIAGAAGGTAYVDRTSLARQFINIAITKHKTV